MFSSSRLADPLAGSARVPRTAVPRMGGGAGESGGQGEPSASKDSPLEPVQSLPPPAS